MQFDFSRVPRVSHPRSVFNRSSGHKSTFDGGYIVPFYCDEVLPGDTMNLKCTVLMRFLSSMGRPVMDNVYVDTFWFFVPLRLLWINFKKFMGEQDNPGDSISYTCPQITGPNVASGGIPIGHLFDYMGLPTGPLSGGGGTTGVTFNNFHGRAYNLIYNTWFRPQDLINSVTVDLGDGPDTFANYNLLRRAKRYDYFTAALPFLQKGTAVSLSLGTEAPVRGLGTPNQVFADAGITVYESGQSSSTTFGQSRKVDPASANNQLYVQGTAASGGFPRIWADLSAATASTVNTLRQSISLQQFLEQDARGGTRYPELNLAHFGVTNPDSRVQRPEILATYSAPLKINPVANTADNAGLGFAGVGTLGAFGTGAQVEQGFTKSFTEHGVILGLINVRADLTYQQGMDRMWSRRTRYDFAWPILSRLGEQEIKNREIYANLPDGTSSNQKDGVFGYIPRYDDYRHKTSKITGDLRSAAPGTLDIWHLSQNFSSQPTLGPTFINDDPSFDRIISVPSEPHFIMDAYFNLKHARVLPVFAVPGLTKL